MSEWCKKILVIDDESCVVDVLMKWLTKGGYQVFGATNGVDGIVANEKENPDLIILDLRMSEMDGIETLRHIRKMDEKVRVVIFSGYIDAIVTKNVENLDVSAYLKKPFDGEQLFQMINNISFGKK